MENMQGKIIKGIAGFYYVYVSETGVYECKAKGVFRNKKIKPLVGDNVLIDIISDNEHTGNITDILPRKNELIRPAVANIDQTMIVFASLSPEPNFNLLSRFLVMMDYNRIDTVICFNKTDQVDSCILDKMIKDFSGCGSRIITSSVTKNKGIDEIREVLQNKTTAFAGPSGVGKSSILNSVFPEAETRTGEISGKINRGKHTTRHTEIFNITGDTFVLDTPGFTSLDYDVVEDKDLRFYFNEFTEYEGKCRFNGCVHVNEPDCAVKAAVTEGKISELRYKIYTDMYNELKNKRKY